MPVHLGRDLLHALSNVVDRHYDVVGLHALLGATDLPSVRNHGQPGGPRPENQGPLPEQREASHGDPGIFVEREVALDAEVDPGAGALQPDRRNVANGDTGNQDPRLRDQALNVVEVRIHPVAGVGGRSLVDVAVDSKGDDES